MQVIQPPNSSDAALLVKGAALRRHLALSRALLDALDRIVPTSDALNRQLGDELSQLGHRVLECSAAVLRADAGAGVSDRARPYAASQLSAATGSL